jgi:hypothetical protein
MHGYKSSVVFSEVKRSGGQGVAKNKEDNYEKPLLWKE